MPEPGVPQNQRRTKRIDDIDPSLPPLGFITVTCGKVHRIIIAEATLFLKETFVIVVERIVGKGLFHQPPQPDPGGQQAEIPHSKGRNIAPCPEVGSGGQLQQRAVQEEQRDAEADGSGDMPPADLAVADALGSIAADGEEQKGAELGRYGMGEQPRRPLDIEQDTINKSPCQPALGQPSVAEPVNMEDKEKHAQPTGELHDTFKGPQIIFLLHGRGILSGENTPARHDSGFDVRPRPLQSAPKQFRRRQC